jgi:YesN/AraC family two-component response regulator
MKIKIKTLISIVFLTIAVSLFSQNTKIDSLLQKLNHAKGIERILVLNDLASEYGYIDFNKSIDLAKEALKLAEIQNYNKSRARSYNLMGRAYFISGNYKVADEYYNEGIVTANRYNTSDDIYKALRLKTLLYLNGYVKDSVESIKVYKQYLDLIIKSKKYNDFQEGLKSLAFVFHSKQNTKLINEYLTSIKNGNQDDKEILAATYGGEAFLLTMNLNYFKAIEEYQMALKFTNVISNKIAHLERIGVVYFNLRKYTESVRYYNVALKLCIDNKFKSNDFILCLIEADLGASYIQLKDYNSAISHLKKALNNPFYSNQDKVTIINNLGQAYLSIDSLDKADSYISKAIYLFDSLKIDNGKLAALQSKATLMIRRQQWSQLPNIINEISKLVNDVQEYYLLYDSYQTLSNYYAKTGNYKKSNEYLKKWITANDSINNRELTNKIKELEFKYETEEKEQQINVQQNTIRQKDILIFLAVIAGSLIFAALIVIFILYRVRNKAYKLLVYKSLENTNNVHLVKTEENSIETKNDVFTLDEELKTQIETSLNKQLNIKVYLEPNLLLKTLAEKCDTNRSYLSLFINERYNMNFNTFVNMLRIKEAKQILSDKNNNIPLKELYLRLGFNTYSVFNEAFKKHIGVTPNFYLKTIKELFDSSKPNEI